MPEAIFAGDDNRLFFQAGLPAADYQEIDRKFPRRNYCRQCGPCRSPRVRPSLDSPIGYYSENASPMKYDGYLRLGYGIGNGTVESRHKQVVHARLRQAGMRWSEARTRRLLASCRLLFNNWALLDRLSMVSNT
jgi:hypothetical protein